MLVKYNKNLFFNINVRLQTYKLTYKKQPDPKQPLVEHTNICSVWEPNPRHFSSAIAQLLQTSPVVKLLHREKARQIRTFLISFAAASKFITQGIAAIDSIFKNKCPSFL